MDGNPWGLRFSRLFDMTNDAGEFRTFDELDALNAHFDGWGWTRGTSTWLPLYEAKMLSHYNPRSATYAEATQAQLNKGTLPRLTEQQLDQPSVEVLAKHWVASESVDATMLEGWDRDWLFGWRDIAGASNVRTFIPSVLPRSAVGNKFPLALPAKPNDAALLQAVWSSYVFDYVSRQKVSGASMNYFAVRQLCCPSPLTFSETPSWLGEPHDSFIRPRVAELAYTSYRLAGYAGDILGDHPGLPFRWLPERRDQIRAELDAAMLHLYGLDRDDAEHVLESFFVVRKYEERDHGEFRTKRLVLAAYDAMAEAAKTRVPFVSPLDPPPGHGPRHLEAIRA